MDVIINKIIFDENNDYIEKAGYILCEVEKKR